VLKRKVEAGASLRLHPFRFRNSERLFKVLENNGIAALIKTSDVTLRAANNVYFEPLSSFWINVLQQLK
jgi:hypothetical protein